MLRQKHLHVSRSRFTKAKSFTAIDGTAKTAQDGLGPADAKACILGGVRHSTVARRNIPAAV